ncbi:hypothetical protein ACFWA9_34450 [Kitasatospora sp. NPDC059973]|uniref:hypothetical protein n=1 Tax=Kitasatospora sp. NPDC059973 TaxID=3347020 RepID=UPI003685960C
MADATEVGQSSADLVSVRDLYGRSERVGGAPFDQHAALVQAQSQSGGGHWYRTRPYESFRRNGERSTPARPPRCVMYEITEATVTIVVIHLGRIG